MLITKPVGNGFSSLIMHLAVIQLSQSIPPQSTSSSSASNSPVLQCSAPGQLISPMQSESLQSIKLSSSSSILLSHISIVSVTLTSGVTIPETNIFSKSFPCKAIKAIEVTLTLLPQCPSAVATLCK